VWKIIYQQSLPFPKPYRENRLPSDSDEMRRIRSAARVNGKYVFLGYSEIDMATLHLAQVLIGPRGDILNHRRKIKPAHVEKLVFGDGPGDSFESVVDTDIGSVGQLNC
jgi:cyanide hydratase